MITSTRIRENGLKGIIIFLLFTVLSVKSCVGAAQPFRPIQYVDIEATSRLRTLVSPASEVKHGFPLLRETDSSKLNNTTTFDFTPINVGMSFGGLS